jgi:hypothetical protein
MRTVVSIEPELQAASGKQAEQSRAWDESRNQRTEKRTQKIRSSLVSFGLGLGLDAWSLGFLRKENCV